MTLHRAILPLPLLSLVLACPSSPSSDDGVADSSSSAGDQTTVAPTTTATSSTTGSSSSDPSSSTTGTDSSSSDDAATSDEAATSDDSSDEGSSGGPTNDCTDEKDPCVLALDVTASGIGGVDQFFVYTVGDGNEHVQLDAVSGDYVSWLAEPWAFGCNLDGPCCLSDGSPCDKPLAQELLELGPGDTAYVFVYANAEYELTIAGG